MTHVKWKWERWDGEWKQQISQGDDFPGERYCPLEVFWKFTGLFVLRFSSLQSHAWSTKAFPRLCRLGQFGSNPFPELPLPYVPLPKMYLPRNTGADSPFPLPTSQLSLWYTSHPHQSDCSVLPWTPKTSGTPKEGAIQNSITDVGSKERVTNPFAFQLRLQENWRKTNWFVH